MIIKAFACLSCTLFLGCSFLLPSYEADKVYVLAPQAIDFERLDQALPSTLLIEQATASRYLDSQRILYSKDGATLPAYQYALWSEPPTERITALLLRAFEARHVVEQVAAGSLFVKADYLLRPEIIQLMHRSEPEPGVAVVSLRAQLMRFSTRTVVATNVFNRQVELQSFDAPGAVHAISIATTEIIRDVVSWSEQVLSDQSKGE